MLDHIKEDVLQCHALESVPTPAVILLQEVHYNAFSIILAHEWVRKHFYITPISSGAWPLGAWYGNVYIKAQLPVKRDMSNKKAPVLGHFAAAMAGLSTSNSKSLS